MICILITNNVFSQSPVNSTKRSAILWFYHIHSNSSGLPRLLSKERLSETATETGRGRHTLTSVIFFQHMYADLPDNVRTQNIQAICL